MSRSGKRRDRWGLSSLNFLELRLSSSRDKLMRGKEMRIRSVQTESKYLKPGDLFSLNDPDEWLATDKMAQIYICRQEFESKLLVYKITIEIADKDSPTMDPHAAPGDV